MPNLAWRAIFVAEAVVGNSAVPAAHSTSAGSTTRRRRERPASAAWLPVALLGVGLIVGVALWAKWGFAIAFEAVRTYCF